MAKLKEGSTIWNPVTKETIGKIATEGYVNSHLESQLNDALDDIQPIAQSEEPPESPDDGELWLDLSDNEFQGTVFDGFDDRLTNSEDNLNNHVGDENNPHNVTKAQVGLSDVVNKEQLGKNEKAVDSEKWNGYKIQVNGTDGDGIINFKTEG